MKLNYTILLSLMILLSCSVQTKKMKSKAKNTPEVAKMLEAYDKQEHRLAFNGCEMTYNEKPFKQGMTIEELINVLGNYSSRHKMFYIWKDIGIVISAKENLGINAKSRYIYIYMNTTVSEDYKEKFKHELNHKKDYFLLEGMPIDKNMRVMDFIANSEFKLNDFGISNYGYELDYNCNGKKISYRLEADGLWLRKGAGHLTYKDKPNPKNENPFEMLYITEIKE
ncbi:hypothetical protein KUL118_67520 [Tenacibaculum sp. KUL118]|nr:hypothetical protein KUL118_67520 [Tenacibaculum sp. KUL118]